MLLLSSLLCWIQVFCISSRLPKAPFSPLNKQPDLC